MPLEVKKTKIKRTTTQPTPDINKWQQLTTTSSWSSPHKHRLTSTSSAFPQKRLLTSTCLRASPVYVSSHNQLRHYIRTCCLVRLNNWCMVTDLGLGNIRSKCFVHTLFMCVVTNWFRHYIRACCLMFPNLWGRSAGPINAAMFTQGQPEKVTQKRAQNKASFCSFFFESKSRWLKSLLSNIYILMAENDFMTSNRCYAHAVVKNKWGHLPGDDLSLFFSQKSVQKTTLKDNKNPSP